ncbi:hypothetical protein GCM10020295_71480 [Streptomyces cinereospinus]
MLVEDGDRGVGLERGVAGEELVQHAAQRVDVTGRARGPAERALRGEVEAGADDLAGGGERGGRVVQEAGDAEVADLQRAVGVQQQVGRFDVAVHDALLVGGGQPGGRLGGDPRHALGGLRARVGEHPGQAVAVHQLHHQEEPVLVRAEVQYADHVRVMQPPGGLRLQPET